MRGFESKGPAGEGIGQAVDLGLQELFGTVVPKDKIG
jgi:hypothetical protein